MIRALAHWSLRPAAWWQFWYPQSGVIGGGIMGWLLLCALVEVSK